jgi:membrane associated rhomboid family serine protease
MMVLVLIPVFPYPFNWIGGGVVVVFVAVLFAALQFYFPKGIPREYRSPEIRTHAGSLVLGIFVTGICIFSIALAAAEFNSNEKGWGTFWALLGFTALLWAYYLYFWSPSDSPTVHEALLSLGRSPRVYAPLIEGLQKHAVVTHGLVGINVLIYLIQAASNPVHLFGFVSLKDALDWGAAYRPAIWEHHEWWRLLMACFIHANFFHVAFNMLALDGLGPWAETLFGSLDFLVIYLLSGLGSSILGIYIHPLVPSVGASGAIYGLVGALLAYSWLVERQADSPHIKRAVIFSFVVAINALLPSSRYRIDVMGHAGGLITGFFIGFLYGIFHVKVIRKSQCPKPSGQETVFRPPGST